MNRTASLIAVLLLLRTKIDTKSQFRRHAKAGVRIAFGGSVIPRTMSPSTEDAAIQDAHALYTLEDLIGRGAYGSVHRATHKLTGEVVALKVGVTSLPVICAGDIDASALYCLRPR